MEEENEEPRVTPRYFWPEQLGERWYHLLRWEGLDEEQVGCGKKHLKFDVDMLT